MSEIPLMRQSPMHARLERIVNYGEAHETYPDPMAVCTSGFATRPYQFDWEIVSTADKGMVDEAGGSFRRDCVGTADDWPDKKKSSIDDQLAPRAAPEGER